MSRSTAATAEPVAPKTAELALVSDDTPDVVIDLRRVRRNLEEAARMAAQSGKHLRPHTKTHKSVRIAHMQLASGAHGVQTAKLGEAEVMADSGISDILVGYPIVTQRKIERLVALAQRANVTVALDCGETAAEIERQALRYGVTISVLVEVDTGHHRTGVLPGRPALKLAQAFARLKQLQLTGFMTHEGHIYGEATTDAQRRVLTERACSVLVDTAELARRHGIRADTVSVGSSATFRYAIEQPGITEVRPGTYVFNDLTQIAHGAATENTIAAIVAATVVSRPRPHEVVIDAGSKALTSDLQLVPPPRPPTYGRLAGHEDAVITRLSEEHAIVQLPGDLKFERGDRVAVIPNHICPVINLFDHATVISDDGTIDRLPVSARGKCQ